MNQTADLLIKHITVFTQDEERSVLPDVSVAVKDGKIAAIGKLDLSRWNGVRELDGRGKYLFPGMINTHVHIFQSLLKGLGADLELIAWVSAACKDTGPRFDKDTYRLACKAAMMEALKSGVTTLGEFFYTQHDDDLPHVGIEMMEKVGIRGLFMDIFHDCGQELGVVPSYIKQADEAIAHTDALYRRYNNQQHPLIRVWAGSSVPWGTTKAGYQAVAEYSNAVGIPYTMHCLETETDNEWTLKHYGKKVVPLLEELGFLSDRFLAVHCVKMTDEEIDTFHKYHVKIDYNPMANAYLGSGIPKIAQMRKKGMTISMGTDGAASNNSGDMLETLKMGLLLQKAGLEDATALSAGDMLDFVTIDGARCIHQEDHLGSVEVGKTADLFVYNPYYLRSCPVINPLAGLMYNSSQENIETTIVGGKIVYHQGEFACGLEEGAVVAEVQRNFGKVAGC